MKCNVCLDKRAPAANLYQMLKTELARKSKRLSPSLEQLSSLFIRHL